MATYWKCIVSLVKQVIHHQLENVQYSLCTVFLIHPPLGLLWDQTMDWVIFNQKCYSLRYFNFTFNLLTAYLLSDLGYDVWMGNARGNRYSRHHVSLTPDGIWQGGRRFWQFSWHEIGIFDLPAMIDYTLAQTGHTRLQYMGHSQGTTSFFVMASERPEYNDKIISMQALAPVAFMSNLRSPFVRAASLFLNTLDVSQKQLISVFQSAN